MITEGQQQHRTSQLERKTKEVSINVMVDIDGDGRSDIKTGIAFLDHIIHSFSKHSKIDINIISTSKDSINHHLIEDTGIVLGQAINRALGNRDRIVRFGDALIPMDESLTSVAVDLIKRQYSHIDLKLERERTENISREDIIHFFNSFMDNLNCCIHIIVQYGANDHHKIESAIKALAVALKKAMKIDPDNEGSPSTKGVM